MSDKTQARRGLALSNLSWLPPRRRTFANLKIISLRERYLSLIRVVTYANILRAYHAPCNASFITSERGATFLVARQSRGS